MIAKSYRWQKTAIAAAAIALLGLTGTGAYALSLGRLTVQSALGEPLRAEIDVPDINVEEAASLRAGIAAPSAFTAAGLDYNPAMSGLQVTLQRRPDGRAFLRLNGDRPVNDPFMDMILETSWSSGRIVRDYTMLFDPPTLRRAAPPPTLAQTTTASTDKPSASPVESARAAGGVKPPAPATAERVPVPGRATPKVAENGTQQTIVKAGDTASKIAERARAASVSLDQMLVALLRANPDAFINGNINRLRSGAVVDIPSSAQANSVAADEATQIISAQSKDFNAFRRNLAASAPASSTKVADRKASGKIETNVQETKPVTVAPDKLTLSKGALLAKAEEAKIAKERADREEQARAAEIAKNISDLTKLRAASAPAPAPAQAAVPAPLPAVPASLPQSTPASAAAVAVAATAAASAPLVPASAPQAPASEPAVVASAPQTQASAPLATEPTPPPTAVLIPEPPGLVDELIENPLIPATAIGLLALLGGFGLYRRRQRNKNATQVDSSFLESRLQPDSFFGASGGQRIDTSGESSATGSSIVYSPSQLDAADDVDPVAEADVYLAYGRDLQAEEILKEAARTTPGRLAIHTKLLEIYAKRRDTRGFEITATVAFNLIGNNTPDWAKICEMGLSIDPSNPLYQPGGVPTAAASHAPVIGASSFDATVSFSSQAAAPQSDSSVDLDLDLDFSLDDEPASAISVPVASPTPQEKHEQTIVLNSTDTGDALDMDFDLSEPVVAATPQPAPAPDNNALEFPSMPASMDGLGEPENEALDGLDFDIPVPTPAPSAPAAPAMPEIDAGMLEFDLGSLSLDLSPPAPPSSEATAGESEDPLETKLALAEEFVSIGDEDGARALIEEVVAEASGEMRAKAQRALANLN